MANNNTATWLQGESVLWSSPTSGLDALWYLGESILLDSSIPSASPSISPSFSPSVSPSESPSLSPSFSPSSSPSGVLEESGTICWGHLTGVTEDLKLPFNGNWTGTGEVQNIGSGDAERISIQEGQYMETEVIYTGARHIELIKDHYT